MNEGFIGLVLVLDFKFSSFGSLKLGLVGSSMIIFKGGYFVVGFEMKAASAFVGKLMQVGGVSFGAMGISFIGKV